MSTQSLKDKADEAFRSGQHPAAIALYTEAISADPSNYLLYSNRSAALASAKQYDQALEDADKCVKLRPDWGKGYARKGLALFYLGRLVEALDAYGQGLDIDPGNPHLESALSMVTQQLDSTTHPFISLLKDSNLVKLMAHPRTAAFFQSQDFHDMINDIRAHPATFSNYVKDERLMEIVSVLVGTDAEKVLRPHESKPDQRLEAANREKELGNAAYKQKKFDHAMEHYEAARDLDPGNMTYLTNMSAVSFERRDYPTCIQQCKDAVSLGRSHGADTASISKALTRQGDAYMKMGDFDSGIQSLGKSLLEHSSDTVKEKLKSAKRLKATKEDDGKSAEIANSEGNALFSGKKFDQAREMYTKAIQINSKEAKYWFNRSACNIKLKNFDEALFDIEKSLEIDPNNPKFRLRKAVILCEKGEKQVFSTYFQEIEADRDESAEIKELKTTVRRLGKKWADR